MLLEDDETQAPAGKTEALLEDLVVAELAEILPETTVRAQFDQIEIFSHTTMYLLTSAAATT